MGMVMGRRVLIALAVTLFAASATTAIAQQGRYVDADVIKALRAGGYVIVLRHAASEPDQADLEPRNFKNIKQQQQLTANGRALAKSFGDAVRGIGARVVDVQTSYFHRAHQTAVLAGYPTAKQTIDLTEGSLVASPNENRRRSEALRKLVIQPVPAGETRLLVTHKINLMNAFGKEWFDVKEGEASIFRVENGAYSLMWRVQMDEWSRIAATAKR